MRRESDGDNTRAILEDQKGEWYAACTKSHHEQLVAKELEAVSITHWLPQVERRRKWSDRYVTILEPIFSGYIFAKVPSGRQQDVLKCRGVVGYVKFNNRPHPIPARELEAVRVAFESKLKCDLYPYLVVGEEVEVKRGSMKGHRGVLIWKNRRHRLVLSINLIGQSVALDINASDVEPV